MLTHHSHHVLRVRLQRLALLVGVVVLVIGPLQADLGVPEHGVADVLVEAQVRQPALAGYAKIVNTIFPEHRPRGRPMAFRSSSVASSSRDVLAFEKPEIGASPAWVLKR